MLEVKQLQRFYGNLMAVNSVSFNINKGEIVGLLGHNGAGKTTIMKMLSGYLEPSAGEIFFDGKNLFENTKLLQQKIGYLPESLPVYSEMSVADYLDYAAELKHIQGKEKQQEIKRVIVATDIAEKLLAPIATLSRGFKQRVGVAQALLGRPQLLILDEPTNGLDPTQTQHMRELICELAKDATVILSTHIMQEVEAVCHRVLMIRAGELVIDSRLSDLHQGCALQLATSLSSEELKTLLASIQEIKHAELAVMDSGLVRLPLHESANLSAVSALIAKTIIGAGAELYELKIEQHNLETLFRQVNTMEAIKHAA